MLHYHVTASVLTVYIAGGAAGTNSVPQLAENATSLAQVGREEVERLVRRRFARRRHCQQHSPHFPCRARCCRSKNLLDVDFILTRAFIEVVFCSETYCLTVPTVFSTRTLA